MVKLLRWGNVVLVMVTLLSYLAPHVSPARFWPLAFFGLIYPWLLLLNVLFVFLWLGMRKYQFLLSFACLLIGYSHLTRFVGLNLEQPTDSVDVFRVSSFNVYGFRDIENGGRYAEEELAELFPTEGLDIVCFQEFPTVKRHNYFGRYFRKKTSLQHAHHATTGALAIFSRYPIKNTHTRYFVRHFNGYQYADIEVEGKVVRVFNVHLQSNSVSSMATEVARDGNLKDRETWLNIRGMAANFKRSATKRAEQSEEIAKAIADSPYPVIVCGDFNAVPQSYTYHQISAGLKDSFQEAGTGLGTTYGGSIPALRIDYIFYSPSLQALDCDVRREPLSDHYSVTTALRHR